MLPDYPELKDKIKSIFTYHMREHKKSVFPLQGMVNTQVIHEGTHPEYQSEYKGKFKDEKLNLKTYSANAQFDKGELKNMTLKDVFLRHLDTVEKMGREIEYESIKELSHKLEEVGQTTKITKEITPDDILKSIEGVALSFDENGKARLPTLMAAPETADKFQKAFTKLDEEPYLTKFRDLIEKKKREWNDRESNRKLAD
jgi:hypothetical protein